MKAPKNGKVEHINPKLARVSCSESDTSWDFTCEGHTWSGVQPKCPIASIEDPTTGASRFSVDTRRLLLIYYYCFNIHLLHLVPETNSTPNTNKITFNLSAKIYNKRKL